MPSNRAPYAYAAPAPTPARDVCQHPLRIVMLAVLIAVVGIIGFALPAQASASDDVVRQVDIEIEIDSDGTVHVEETYQWDFGTRNGLGFYRSLIQYAGYSPDPQKMRRYEYSDYQVHSPSGAPAEVWVDRSSGSEIVLAVGAPDGSTDTRTGVQTYVLSYEIRGTLNAIRGQDGVNDQDEFYWNILSNSANPIEVANVTVTGPAQVVDHACYQGPAGSQNRCADYSASGSTAEFRATGMAPDDAFTIMAAWPAVTFGDTDPILVDNQSSSWADNSWDDDGPITTLGNFIRSNWGWVAGGWAVVLAGIVVRRRIKGRDLHYVGLPPGLTPAGSPGARGVDVSQAEVAPLTTQPPVTVQFTPPPGITPAEAGVILDKRADPQSTMATLVDLAVRGYLTIEETAQNWNGKPKDWRISRVPQPPSGEGLKEHESTLLQALLKRRQSVTISQLRGSFASNIREFRRDLERQSDAQGWYTRKGLTAGPASGGTRFGRTITGAGFAIIGIAIFSIAFTGGGLPAHFRGSPASMVTLGFTAMALIASLVTTLAATSSMRRARSAHGRALYEQVRGFKEYLSKAEAHQIRWEQGQDIFSQYLPWAMVFGVADRWAQIFEQLAAEGRYTAMPYWYVSTQPFSPSSFRNVGASMSSLATTGAASLNYTPGSSGGSGSFSSGGGGGFSGGGGGGGGVGGR